MIFKIEGKFEEFDNLINQIIDKYIFLYTSRVLFVAPKHCDDLLDLRKIFDDEYYDVTEIDSKNIMQENPVVLEWLRDNFVRLETERFNKNEQDRLEKIWSTLDVFEKDLEEKERRMKENG